MRAKYLLLFLICCDFYSSAAFANKPVAPTVSRIEVGTVTDSEPHDHDDHAGHKHTDSHIIGHVVDATTLEHIPYVTIGLKGTTVGTVSDRSGHYALRNLPHGTYTFVASCAGYKTAETRIEIVAGKTLELNIELAEDHLTTDEVVVTGSRTATNRRFSPTIVVVANQKLFQATASVSPAEVLNFQTGMRMENTCNNCGVPQLRINGLQGQYSQVLLDSRPMFSSLANVYGLEQFPVAMIERIEVLRGGGSALYGSNAIGGVVNIITREPLRNSVEIANQTALMAGKAADISTTLNATLVSEDYRAGISIFGMVRDRHQYDRNDDGFSDVPRLSSETIGMRGYYKTTAYSKLTAEYHHIREYRRGGNAFSRPPHEADIAEQLRHGINGGALKYDYNSRDLRHTVNVFASAQTIARSSYFGAGQNPDAYGQTHDDTFVGGGQYMYGFDRLWFAPSKLIAGVEYTYNYLHDRMLGYHRDLKQITNTTGFYFQNEWQTEQFNFLVGGRLDKNNLIDHAIFSPRISGRYTPVNGVTLRASYSSGYRAPQAYDEDLHVAAVNNEVKLIELDPNLKPEYSHSATLSLDLSKQYDHFRLGLLTEGFFTYLKDVFYLGENGQDDQGNYLFMRRNGSGARVAGINVEASFNYRERWYAQLGYTWQRSRYTQAESWSENPDLLPQKRMFRTPDHYGFAMVEYSPLPDLKFSVNGVYTGSMLIEHQAGYIDRDRNEKTPSFFDMGLRVAYEFNISPAVKMQVSGGVKNLFDAFQKDLDRGEDKDASYIYGPAIPRSYFVGVKFSL